jgi:uncharacterized protein YPO0396
MTEPTSPKLKGFRLDRLEVYNWGTFDGRVWSYELDGRNSLLTGDIGSGKSTLVDAVTTLLVPAQRVQYNRAAGAEKQERSLRTYFYGHYKSARSDHGPTTKAVAHRKDHNYSVLLANFRNRELGQTVTIAQVFWIKEPNAPPARFYLVADQELRIAEHFADFQADISRLKKRLRAQDAEIFESFPPYSAAFRRRFGLANEQALELFHQTISMKAVGNLTSFVREQMLEEFDMSPRIEALITHFEDLNRAHESILIARAQVEALAPLVAEWHRYGVLNKSMAELRQDREALRSYFCQLKIELLKKRRERLRIEEARQNAKHQTIGRSILNLERQCAELRQARADNGGDRLERLATDAEKCKAELERRRGRHRHYRQLVESLGLSVASSPEEFEEQRLVRDTMLAQEAGERAHLENLHTELAVELRGRRDSYAALEAELVGLRRRRSNLPQNQVELRSELCSQLGVPTSELPYVGELLTVKEPERDWEGAIERLLHNFALSLLVPERHYPRVSDWVDRTRLRGRLVYYKVVADNSAPKPIRAVSSLVEKVEIKPDTHMHGWLNRELRARFDVACCANIEQFRKEDKAITRNGQVKMPGGRHEKDDRHGVDDRSRYVLGWSNEAKIQLLEARLREIGQQAQKVAEQLESTRKAQAQLGERRDALTRLLEYRDFQEIAWEPLVKEVAALEQERRELESASNILQELTVRLAATEEALRGERLASDELSKEMGGTSVRLSEAEAQLHALSADAPQPSEQERFPRLEKLREEVQPGFALSLESADNKERELREVLGSRIDAEAKKIDRSREKILSGMHAFRHAYPLESQDMDASVMAGREYEKLLERLNSDDLPRFQERFKQLLNENTIREIANFQSQLWRERESIKGRVEAINGSLRQIDYNPGRYIVLEVQPTTDADIRDFQAELRACTEGSLTGSDDEQYSETKFLRVRAIIERFKGREGTTDLDRRWTRRVTDVRQWFTFSASERWRADDSEHEHYSDSGGKSGGQKEKLAYTVLAASLSYQYGLESTSERKRTFHFVVIDEAFGRSSDESTQFGLELFEKMDLQLLIVTPLQKIHIIEPFLSSVGYCFTDPDTARSQIQNLTIEEYHVRKLAAIS